MSSEARTVGDLLRQWRQRRRLSQLGLACEAEISTKHLSFIETGRALPSREMILRLAEHLEVPLRQRNVLLTAAGYAPSYRERPLGDPELQAARRAIESVLAAAEPCPALAVDRHWTLIAANRALAPLLTGVHESLTRPPVNVLRVSLHPDGLAPRIANLPQWRAHVLARLHRQIDLTADPVLMDLLEELRDYALPVAENQGAPGVDWGQARVAVPFELAADAGLLSFFSTTTVFGTPIDITLSELALETFFPADAATAQFLRAAAVERSSESAPDPRHRETS